MERNKKNTVIDTAEPTLRKNRSTGSHVKGAITVAAPDPSEQKIPVEINGPKGPEPTRYGDWEQKGRCTDF